MAAASPTTAPTNQANGQAIASVVLGVLSFVIMLFIDCVPFVSALLAIWAGVRGLVDAKRLEGRGKFMAMTGIGLGALAIVLTGVQSFIINQRTQQPLIDQIVRATGTAAAQQTQAADPEATPQATPEATATASPLTFTQDEVTVTYPDTWEPQSLEEMADLAPICEQQEITCLMLLMRQGGGGVHISLMRFTLSQKTNVVTLEEQFWQQGAADMPDLETQSREEIEINGVPAIKRVFTQPGDDAKTKYYMQFALIEGLNYYQMTAAMFGDDTFDTYAAEAEAIVASLTLAPVAVEPTAAPELVSFTQDEATLTYPDTWKTRDFSTLEGNDVCQEEGNKCLMFLERPDEPLVNISLIRYTLETEMSVAEADAKFWAETNTTGMEVEVWEELEVNGRPAIIRIAKQLHTDPSLPNPAYYWQLHIVEGPYLYGIFGTILGKETFATHAAEVEAIAKTLTLDPTARVIPEPITDAPVIWTMEEVTVTYPGTWKTLDVAIMGAACKEKGIKCLLVLALRKDQTINMNLMRATLPENTTLTEIDEATWEQMTSKASAAELIAREELEVNGLPAIKRVFMVPPTDNNAKAQYFFTLYVVSGENFYQFMGGIKGEEAFEAYEAEMTEILTSLTIEQ